MKAYTIAHIPGDGIGKDVTEAGWEVLQAAARRGGFALEDTRFPWSCAYYLETGAMMPPDGIEILRSSMRSFSALSAGRRRCRLRLASRTAPADPQRLYAVCQHTAAPAAAGRAGTPSP